MYTHVSASSQLYTRLVGSFSWRSTTHVLYGSCSLLAASSAQNPEHLPHLTPQPQTLYYSPALKSLPDLNYTRYLPYSYLTTHLLCRSCTLGSKLHPPTHLLCRARTHTHTSCKLGAKLHPTIHLLCRTHTHTHIHTHTHQLHTHTHTHTHM